MHDFDTTPIPAIAILAIIAVLVLVVIMLWSYFHLGQRLDNFFALRRHQRRMRNYVKADVKLTQASMTGGLALISLDTGKVTRYAPARHRR